jgi:hypothetical protein
LALLWDAVEEGAPQAIKTANATPQQTNDMSFRDIKHSSSLCHNYTVNKFLGMLSESGFAGFEDSQD